MNLKENYLNTFIKEKTIIDLYCDCYDESHIGNILSFNDEFLVLNKYEEDGRNDGISIFFKEDISRIRWNGNSLNTIQSFINETKLKNIDYSINLASIKTILEDMQNIFTYVTVHIHDLDTNICLIGEIVEIDNETLVLNEYGTFTSLDRKNIMLSLDDITLVDGGGIYEEQLKRIFNKKA